MLPTIFFDKSINLSDFRNVLDAKTQVEYDRIKAGPHSGYFSFLHHEGPIMEHSENVMERVTEILYKDQAEWYDRLRHILYLDPQKIPAAAKVKPLDDDYQAKRESLYDEIVDYLRSQIKDCRWDGETILGKGQEV